jgi:FkbM family methyltransferase
VVIAMPYELGRYAREHFPQIADRKEREHQAEVRLVHEFFGHRDDGVFVEVGANHPTMFSQTWYLEQQGWRGILVEPTPALCELLRAQRPKSEIVEAACGGPEQVGRATFRIAGCHVHSSLSAEPVAWEREVVDEIDVELTTLDAILDRCGEPHPQFVSIDVEGDQLAVLRGFDLRRHQPELVLLEDHLTGYATHRLMTRQGYRLVKRTGFNSWYVPRSRPFALTSPRERFRLWRKVWLKTPFRGLRARVRRMTRR